MCMFGLLLIPAPTPTSVFPPPTPTLSATLAASCCAVVLLSEEELSLLSGNDTNQFKCKKTIMEKELNYAYPLVDCLKDLQNPDHIVPQWTNGGEDTRSYKNRAEFNKRCQY